MNKSLMVLMLVAVMTLGIVGAESVRVPLGRDVKVEGVIVSRSADGFVLRAHNGMEYQVTLGPGTQLKEAKKNPFRQAERYAFNDLALGLNARVEGRGDTAGSVLADTVRFTQNELKIARTITSSTEPIDRELKETQGQLDATREELALTNERLSTRADQLENQVEELDAAYDVVRQESRGAQRTADHALAKATAVDQRLSELDNYAEIESRAVNFGFNSFELTAESKQVLDELAEAAAAQTGYLIEVTGYASADGNPEHNRVLSSRRADAVIDYLVNERGLPLRRIIRPHGFGEHRPIADNATREGRRMNRRVEVKLMRSEGIGRSSMSTAALQPELSEIDSRN